jgi:hypothetical protein
VGVAGASRVGDGTSVSVGRGISVNISVAGRVVFVGMVACVPVVAVFCTLKPSSVGVAAGVPQALIDRVKSRK